MSRSFPKCQYGGDRCDKCGHWTTANTSCVKNEVCMQVYANIAYLMYVYTICVLKLTNGKPDSSEGAV